MLATPVVGSLMQKVAIARFARTYASLIRAGVVTPKALGIAAEATANSVIAKAVLKARASAEAGHPLTAGLAGGKFIPREFVEMIRTGEKSGRTDEMLDSAAEYYEAEVNSATTILAIVITALVTVLIGLIVGGIAIAALMPMLQLPAMIH
jgi:type IV pilus assembly protein PilC